MSISKLTQEVIRERVDVCFDLPILVLADGLLVGRSSHLKTCCA